MHLLLVSCIFIAILKVSSGGLPDPSGTLKKKTDETPEKQFYKCFSDMNCHMGDEVRNKIFNCYHKASDEEITEYLSWFQECPVGDFSYKTIEEVVIKSLCALTTEQQNQMHQYFSEKAAELFLDVCKKDKGSGKCKRMNKGKNCLTFLIGETIFSGECGTPEEKAEEMVKS